MASDEPDTNRTPPTAWGKANSKADAWRRGIHTATHNRLPIPHPYVSRETCRRLLPRSIPAHTGISFMTGKGPGAN